MIAHMAFLAIQVSGCSLTFDNPESVKLGHCNLIEEIMIDKNELIHFSGVAIGQASTMVFIGAMYFLFFCFLKFLSNNVLLHSQAV